MKLKKLLAHVSLDVFRGSKEVEITGLCADSKRIAPGNLFIAKKGMSDDGSRYIDEALSAGAAAILSSDPNPFLKDVVQLTHPDIPFVEGKLAAAFYNDPSHELSAIGVTGTSGKTTTTYILKHLLGQECGLIGGVEYIMGQTRRSAEKTTPDVISNHKMLREMVSAGCKTCAIEVSSHGLVQRRVDQIAFKAALFTNLSHEHLDYHKTMEEYASAKQLLFNDLGNQGVAVINLESPYAQSMVKHCPARIVTFGFTPKADLCAHDIALSLQGTTFKATWQGITLLFSWKLIGAHNVLNALGALATLLAWGYDFALMPKLLRTFQSVPGRLERVGRSSVFVDHAHKPDALDNVLSCLCKAKTKGRVITVFGCGGDRDKVKRPLMAKIAEKWSDMTIITSDNPRSEDPQAIIAQILSGFTSTQFVVEPDRYKAIEKAIAMASGDDIVLIAGKGHENVQIFAHKSIPFDDRVIASEILAKGSHT